jgi:hypothetical protein
MDVSRTSEMMKNVSPSATDRLFSLELFGRMGVLPWGVQVLQRCGRWLSFGFCR